MYILIFRYYIVSYNFTLWIVDMETESTPYEKRLNAMSLNLFPPTKTRFKKKKKKGKLLTFQKDIKTVWNVGNRFPLVLLYIQKGKVPFKFVSSLSKNYIKKAT